MVQRRTRIICPHGDAARPYAVWPEPGWPLGQDSELDGALAELESALTDCDMALANSIAALTNQDVSSALRSLPLERRQAVLRPLGLMLTPRQISQSLCQDVRSRMRKADEHQARHASSALTRNASIDVVRSVFAVEETALPRAPSERWGSALCRLAVWSYGLASVRDARVWLWAIQQSWFCPDRMSDEQLEAIVEAAERVVKASPEFMHHGSGGDSDDEPNANAVGASDDSGPDDVEASDPARGVKEPDVAGVNREPQQDKDTNGVTVDGMPSSAEALDAPHTSEELAATSDALDVLLAEALHGAQDMLERLRAKRPPTREDLARLSRTREAFDEVVASLTAAGVHITDESMPAVRKAIEEINAKAVDATARQQLELVCGLTMPQEQALLLTQLSQAQTEARELLRLQSWDEEARGSAAVLGLLAELAMPDRDTAAQIAMMQQLSHERPGLSFLALQAQQLRLPASVAPSGDTAAQERPPDCITDVKPVSEAMTTQAAGTKAGQHAQQPPADVQVPAVGMADTGQTDAVEPPESEIQPAQGETTDPKVGAVEGATGPVAPSTHPEASAQPELRHLTELTDAAERQGLIQSSEQIVAQEPGTVSAERIRAAVAQLIVEQRLGLATALARIADWTRTQQSTLRVAVLAGVIRHQNGAVAAALRDEFDALDSTDLASDTPSLLLAVPALLRAALVTGEPTTGALLTDLAAHVEPNLSEVAEQVGRRALHGVLLDSQALSVLADVTEVERGMSAITSAANYVRTRHRTMRFKRATDISKMWLDPQGILGRPLSIVERDETTAVGEVASDIEQLSNSGFIKTELAKLDRRFQGSSGKPIEGAVRQDLINLVREALKPLADWVEAVQSLRGRDARAAHWSAGDVANMRTVVLKCRDGALTSLEGFTSHHNPLIAAAAHAAATSLTATFDILQGTRTLPVREPAPALALTAELLKVPGVSVDAALGQVTLPQGASTRDLLEAAERSWDEALLAQVTAENFEAAHFLLDVAAAGQLTAVEGREVVLATESAAEVEQAEGGVRAELDAEHGMLITTLQHARVNSEISDEQYGELTSLLEDAGRQARSRDLAFARRTLQRAAALLPEYRAEAKARLGERLQQMKANARVDGKTFERVRRLIDDGQLSTAEELIYFLEIDEDLPDVYQSQDLPRFFPAVPNALPSGVTRELVMLVAKRGRLPGCPVLDFSGLSPDLAETASDALNAWRQASQVEPGQRNNVSEPAQLLPALRMIGIETGGVKKLNDWPRSRDRRFIEVTVNGIIGKALVPSFGSKLDGRLHVLLAWGQPSADLLMSWADGDRSGESLLIAHFGSMSAQTRRDLAVKAVRRSAPIMVLDDAALVYLAAHGNRQMAATMNVLLPFSSVNPYLRQKRGVVAPEMFYGRDQERRSVLDPDGTQLVFGGRGLGKSALLNSAAEQFQEQTKTAGERVAVYLDLKAVGIRAESAIDQGAIWDALLDVLTRREVLAAPGKNARRISPREQVQSGVQAWLDADSRRRLLVLLDEADQFFEADMPHFLETTRLKSLGEQSNGRVKVVFAGLHSVQRYAKTARNAPFGHMAQRPTVIGPLKPQHAANLLTQPLAALGFGFEDPDLVNRVLGHCSYQPFLLQIFANRLIEAMHAKRNAAILGVDEPPYVITRADVEAVETHADLRADIRAAFHETLNLDHRYGVIAHVLAHHAHEHGLDARLTDTQLREECLSYWHSGFAKLDVEGFRAYLQEMTGLGVLAPNNDGRGWHLRSANVLNMIGTREDVEAQLVTAAELSVPDEFLALESRQELPSGRRSPLTAAQIDDVLGDHSNQVRVVLGSQATGVDFVSEAVCAAANVGNRFAVSIVSSRRQFEEQLVTGKPGERRVVLDDLVSVAPNEMACLEALEVAQTRQPLVPGVTRAAVIVAGPEQMNLWRQAFAQADGSGLSTSGLLPVITIALRRYDAATLRVWSLETNIFTSEERRAQLLQVTGGWPALVEQAAQLVKGELGVGDSGGVDESEALQQLESQLATPHGAAGLVAAVGLSSDEQLSCAFEAVLSVIESGSLTRADLEVAAELSVDEPTTVIECLIAQQVFDLDADGKFVPEPLLVRCWPHRG